MDTPNCRVTVNLESVESNARGRGRINVQGLETSVGHVMDISASGMKVRCGAENWLSPGKLLDVDLISEAGEMTVKAEVIRTKVIGLSQYEVGFKFLDVPESDTSKLWGIVSNTCRP